MDDDCSRTCTGGHDSRKYDSVVTSVISAFQKRAEIGKKKYGTDLDRKDLSILDWIQHAQEEHMDAILYLEKLKQEVKNERHDGQQPPLQESQER
jgi:hypothetical protein